MNRVPQNRHLKFKNIILLILTIQILACVGQVKEKVINHDVSITTKGENLIGNISTTFPQIHANLNGMVKEFVRTMHQDKKGQYWFGTNGNGIIRYDGKILEAVVIEGVKPNMRILEIIEDKNNNIWFATSEGLIKYDGNKFTPLPHTSEDQKKEIWGLAMDKNEIIWIGALDGVYRYNGESFIPFELPQLKVKKWRPMLSSTLIFKIIEDQNRTMWFPTDGNGIFTLKNNKFDHLT